MKQNAALKEITNQSIYAILDTAFFMETLCNSYVIWTSPYCINQAGVTLCHGLTRTQLLT
jgi:hypothetical protein